MNVHIPDNVTVDQMASILKAILCEYDMCLDVHDSEKTGDQYIVVRDGYDFTKESGRLL